jgi:hypothetical protein
MARGRRLYKLAAILFSAAGMMTAAIQHANAATGAGGLTILYASSQNQAHQCNVIGSDSNYQAVVCSDLLTYEGATDYYAYGREEAYCQRTSTPHTIVACREVRELDTLEAGDGTSTSSYSANCGLTGSCQAGRNYLSTRNWDYSISHAENGVCSSNVGSSYQLYNIAWHGYTAAANSTEIWTPDGAFWSLGVTGTANDGVNESSGHYFICP